MGWLVAFIRFIAVASAGVSAGVFSKELENSGISGKFTVSFSDLTICMCMGLLIYYVIKGLLTSPTPLLFSETVIILCSERYVLTYPTPMIT